MPLRYITRKYMRDFKNVSIFHSVLSCICYVITAGTKNSKSSKDRGNTSKTYSDFWHVQPVQSGKACMHSPLYDWFQGRIQKILITGIQLVHTGEAIRDLKQGRRRWQWKRRWKKWICVLSNLLASIWARSICQMLATFPGVESLRILLGFKKRKENSYVHVLHKTAN